MDMMLDLMLIAVLPRETGPTAALGPTMLVKPYRETGPTAAWRPTLPAMLLREKGQTAALNP